VVAHDAASRSKGSCPQRDRQHRCRRQQVAERGDVEGALQAALRHQDPCGAERAERRTKRVQAVEHPDPPGDPLDP
jgi:hypothetical protein